MHLDLDLDLDAEPVTGHVGRDGGEPRSFTGYASLIAAVESIRRGDPSPDPPLAAAHREGSEGS
jgi:hypothetical protein